MLSLGLGGRSVLLLAWLRGGSVLGLRIISSFSLGLNFLGLGSVYSFRGVLFLLILVLVLGSFNPSTLITSLAGSLQSLGERERSLGSQGLLRSL